MKAKPECLPCCLTRILRLAEQATDNEWLLNRVLDEMMSYLKKRQQDNSPSEIMNELFHQATKILGDSDPYLQKKRILLEELIEAEEDFRSEIKSSGKSLKLAIKLSCISNIFDDDLLEDFDISGLFNNAENINIHSEFWDSFIKDLKKSKKVVFIHNSAGELIFDKMLMECMPEKEWISVVKNNPVLNFATFKDAEKVKLDSISSEIVTLGDDNQGLSVNQSSQELQDHYESADLIIAKGQSSYEILNGENKKIYFLFRVKCRVMADKFGLKINDLVLEKS